MKRLPHERRRQIFLLMMEGLGPKEIAGRLDMPKSTVENDYYPIRAMVTEMLRGEP